jgi:hypothetical protein
MAGLLHSHVFAVAFGRETVMSSSVSDLVQRLRPEAIRKSPNSLSSDVFSMFEEGNPSLEDVHKPVEIITSSLLSEVVPDVTVRLIQGYTTDRLPTLGKLVSSYATADRCAVLEVSSFFSV